MRARFIPALWILVGGAAGCIDGFETESAYRGQRYLCSDTRRALMSELVEECRMSFEADASCAGVLSVTGTLEGQAMTFESLLTMTLWGYQPESGRLLELDLRGASPYFNFNLGMESIGAVTSTSSRELRIDRGASLLRDGETDDAVRIELRVFVGGVSGDHLGTTDSGVVELSVKSEVEVTGEFYGDFSGDAIEGCFHAFATERRGHWNLP
jgi:hypothetical protein